MVLGGKGPTLFPPLMLGGQTGSKIGAGLPRLGGKGPTLFPPPMLGGQTGSKIGALKALHGGKSHRLLQLSLVGIPKVNGRICGQRSSGIIRIGASEGRLLPVPNTKDFGRTTTFSMPLLQEGINGGVTVTERTAKKSSVPRSKITASLWSTSWDNGGRRKGFFAFGDGRLVQLETVRS